MRLKISSVCALLAALASSSLSGGELITVREAYAETSFDGRPPSRAVDGSGLTGDTHDTDTSHMWMGSNTGNGGGRAYANWFAVDFGDTKSVGLVKIWNYNQSGYMNRGFKGVEVYVATQADAFSPNGNTGSFNLEASAVWKKVTTEDVARATGETSLPASASFDLKGVSARWIVLKATTLYSTDTNFDDSNKRGGYGGLSEVQFYTADAVVSRATLDSVSVNDDQLTLAGTLQLVGAATSGELIVGYGVTDGTAADGVWTQTETISCDAGDFEKTVALTGLTDGRYYVAVGVRTGDSVVWSATKRFQYGTITAIEWVGEGDGETWNNPANWNSGSVPTEEDTVVFGGDVTTDLSVIRGEGEAAVAKTLKFASAHKVTLASLTAQTVEVLETAAPTNVITALTLAAPEEDVAVWNVAAGKHLGVGSVAGSASLRKTGSGSSGIGSVSSRTAGETEVLEGLLVFSQSGQLGTKLVVGGGANPAVARANNNWQDKFNPFAGNARTIEVKDKGFCDFASDGSAQKTFPDSAAGPIVVRAGGRFALGQRKISYNAQNAATDFASIDVAGEFTADAGSSITLDRSHFNVHAAAPTSVVVRANLSMQTQEGGICTFCIEDIPSAPVDCTLAGKISYAWLPRDGFVKTGSGVLRLTGDNAYGGLYGTSEGRTDIQAGTVLVDNTTGSGSGASIVVVGPSTCLGGTGTIGGNTAVITHWKGPGNYGTYAAACVRAAGSAEAQAVVAPGTIDDTTGAHIVGTLHVGSADLANPVTLGNYSTLRIGVRPEGVDRLEVCGKVTLGTTGTVLDFDVSGNTTKVHGRHVILSATEGIEGDFASVTGVVKKYRPQFNEDRTELSIDIPGALMVVVR